MILSLVRVVWPVLVGVVADFRQVGICTALVTACFDMQNKLISAGVSDLFDLLWILLQGSELCLGVGAVGRCSLSKSTPLTLWQWCSWMRLWRGGCELLTDVQPVFTCHMTSVESLLARMTAPVDLWPSTFDLNFFFSSRTNLTV
jgi:hypothetical protein